jgi:hypothetical protein
LSRRIKSKSYVTLLRMRRRRLFKYFSEREWAEAFIQDGAIPTRTFVAPARFDNCSPILRCRAPSSSNRASAGRNTSSPKVRSTRTTGGCSGRVCRIALKGRFMPRGARRP